MAAYAALVSVMQILHQIENHPSPPISIDKKQVESLTEIVTFLQEFLEGYNSPFADSNEADPLEMRIADAAYAAEDVIESNIVDNIKLIAETTHDDDDDDESTIVNRILPAGSESLKEPKNDGEKINSVDLNEGLKKVIEDMDLIKKEVTEIKKEKEEVQTQDRLLSLDSTTLWWALMMSVLKSWISSLMDASIAMSSRLLGWAESKYDAVVGDVTIVANRLKYVDFTFPYTESGVATVVPIKDTRGRKLGYS